MKVTPGCLFLYENTSGSSNYGSIPCLARQHETEHDSGDWVKVSNSWPKPTQLVFFLALEISAYNSVLDLVWKAAWSWTREVRTLRKWREVELVPGNLKNWLLRAVWKNNPKLYNSKHPSGYNFALGFLLFFFSSIFYPIRAKPIFWMLQIKTAFPRWTGIEQEVTSLQPLSHQEVLEEKQGEPPNPKARSWSASTGCLLLQWPTLPSLWPFVFPPMKNKVHIWNWD